VLHDSISQLGRRGAGPRKGTAVHFRRPTKGVRDIVRCGMAMSIVPTVIAIAGGLPQLRDGVVIGSIGVSGLTSAEDVPGRPSRRPTARRVPL